MEQHRLAGIDARERGFSRPIEFVSEDGGVRAVLRYETIRVETVVRETPGLALQELVCTLHRQGYSQLRSQLSFRAGTYLGSQEPWIEYPDPEGQTEQQGSWIGRWFRCLLRRSEETHG